MSTATYYSPSSDWNHQAHSNGFTTWNEGAWQNVPYTTGMYPDDQEIFAHTPPPPYAQYTSYATTTNALGLSFGNNGQDMQMESNTFESIGYADVYGTPSQPEHHLQLDDPGYYPPFTPAMHQPSIPPYLFIPPAGVGYGGNSSNGPTTPAMQDGHLLQEAVEQETTAEELLKAPRMGFMQLFPVDEDIRFEAAGQITATDGPGDSTVATFPGDEDSEDAASIEAYLLVADFEKISLEGAPNLLTDNLEYHWE